MGACCVSNKSEPINTQTIQIQPKSSPTTKSTKSSTKSTSTTLQSQIPLVLFKDSDWDTPPQSSTSSSSSSLATTLKSKLTQTIKHNLKLQKVKKFFGLNQLHQ